ncbi:MAG: DUF362 domain-containing protein [Candidatus Omnitrophota bacterium]
MVPKTVVEYFNGTLGSDPLRENSQEIHDLLLFLESTLALILDLKAIIENKTVFIKPNLNFVPTKLNPYAMTDPRLLFALVQLIHKNRPKNIIIGEKGGQKKPSQFSYDLLRQHFNIPSYVELMPIDTEKRVEIETLTKITSQKLSLPESYVRADVVINIPKMKTHSLTDVSLGIKNLFGLLTDEEKIRQHNEDIVFKLVDLLSIRQPDITIIDGIFALEGQGPLYGTPRRNNIIVAGNECLATDAVAAFLMGFEPAHIAHMALAARYGLGKINFNEIELKGKNPNELRQNFIKADFNYNPVSNVVDIIKGRDIPSGYLNAISHSLERIFYENLNPVPLKIYVGKFANILPENKSIIFGDVTADSVHCNDSMVIKGHPPIAFALYDIIKELFLDIT